jgi:hypothetical protein
LLRLGTVLAAAGLRPGTVSLLPDRDSRILGLAAAEILGLPAESFVAGRRDTVVIAYNLDGVIGEETRAAGGAALTALLEREPGQVLHEHASCWTDAPPITADSVGLLYQSLVPPWGALLRQDEDGQVERTAPDGRSVEELAAEIVRARPSSGDGDREGDSDGDGGREGDGGTPPDSDELLAAFAAAVRGEWLQGGRPPLRSSGPVPSSRFL